MLSIENFSLVLKGSDNRLFPVLENISLKLNPGECLGLAGESGSGKSVLAMSIVGLIPKKSIVSFNGSIKFDGHDFLRLGENELRKYRGSRIGFIFQEPMTAMNPLMTLYEQVAEVIFSHCPEFSKKQIGAGVEKALRIAGFSEPEKFYHSYPHQLSGGMRQRAMIAIGMAMEPELIIADEPTTAIDAGLQVQLVNKLKEIVGKGKRSMIFISHDLGVLRNVSDRIAIIYAGNIVEQGAAQEIMTRPCHPYSRDLIAALPRLVKDKRMPSAIPGTLPQPDNKPQGCVYSDRCALAQSKCRTHRPELKEICSNRQVRCFFPVNLES